MNIAGLVKNIKKIRRYPGKTFSKSWRGFWKITRTHITIKGIIKKIYNLVFTLEVKIMLQIIYGSSAIIALLLLSLLSFVVGWRSFHSRKEQLGTDVDERVLACILFGGIGTAISSSVLLIVFVHIHAVFLIPLLISILLFVLGEWTLRIRIITRKVYFVPLSFVIIGGFMALFNPFFLLNVHEPFTFIYAIIVGIGIVFQFFLIESWRSKRTP